jgi:crotonobetainyl-CoA:carnitine CoA-transferase CaiB-like acyl-CoA transferase
VNRAPDVLADPHYRERRFFAELDHLVAGRLTQPGLPFKFVPGAEGPRPAPTLGQHNIQVYCGRLGLSPEDLAGLRQAGAI